MILEAGGGRGHMSWMGKCEMRAHRSSQSPHTTPRAGISGGEQDDAGSAGLGQSENGHDGDLAAGGPPATSWGAGKGESSWSKDAVRRRQCFPGSGSGIWYTDTRAAVTRAMPASTLCPRRVGAGVTLNFLESPRAAVQDGATARMLAQGDQDSARLTRWLGRVMEQGDLGTARRVGRRVC